MGLLMRITSTKTDPVLVYTLPNGLGIYKSPFKDRDGCSLAYGGPHQMFSCHYTKVSGNDSYNQFMGELYRVRGEIWEKALGLDPCDPARDCGHALQLPVNCPRGTVYFYPTPLEASSVQEVTGLDCSDPDDDDPLVTVMKSCYKANIPIACLRE